jgi:negative regulator of sigma E activity
MKATDMNTDAAANDLTQLSSREQLSALMDSALPPDQTRFLLRRLQHDAPLAECWERWRIAGEVMRGLAPARRMPADFASRVSAALHDGGSPQGQARSERRPAWLRWGGGAAMAASLAMVALMARQGAPADVPPPAPRVAASTQSQPAATAAAAQAPVVDTGSQLAVAAAAASATAIPQRKSQRAALRVQPAAARDAASEADAAQLAALEPAEQAPQPDILTRPWPRSVLPQYAGGGLTVGFGEPVRGDAPYNPFQPQPALGSLPPLSTTASDGDAPREPEAADGSPQEP